MPELPGHRRRAFIRRLLGKPGSTRRWLLANLIGLPLAAATMNLYVVMAAVLFSTMWVMYLRDTLIEGNEDEMRAWVRWQNSRRNPDRGPAAESAPLDPTDWFNTHPNTFIDAPPPPVFDEAEAE